MAGTFWAHSLILNVVLGTSARVSLYARSVCLRCDLDTLYLSAQSGIDCRRDSLGDDDENTACASGMSARCFSSSTRPAWDSKKETKRTVRGGESGPEFVSACGSFLPGRSCTFVSFRRGLARGGNTGSLPINSAGEAVLLNGRWTTTLY